MNIAECILKIHPNWKGVVWENDYDRIIPNETETRPTPSLGELETAWLEVEKEKQSANDNIEKEILIQAKIREQSVSALKIEGKLTADGKLKK